MSLAGRDKGHLFFITDISDNYVYMIDGDIHKVENPKYKKLKHIKLTDFQDETVATKIKNKSKITNQEVKRVLRSIQPGGNDV